VSSAFLFILLVVSTTGQRFDRHSFGYVLQEKQQLYVSTVTAKVIYYYKLPGRLNNVCLADLNCTGMESNNERGRPTHANMRVNCMYMVTVLESVRDMRIRVQNHVKVQLDNIYDVLSNFPSTRTVKRGLMTEFISRVTELASKQELNDLQDVLYRIETGITTAASAWKQGSDNFMAAFRVERRRITNIYDVLDMQKQSVLQLQQQLVSDIRSHINRSRLLMKLINSVTSLVFQVSKMDDFYLILQMLNVGKLSHFFVHHSTLRRSIAYMNQFLMNTHRGLTLLRTDIHYYYNEVPFHVFRQNEYLVVILQASLTLTHLKYPLNVYEIIKIPILAPHDHSHFTMLSTNFEGIAYSPDSEYFFGYTETD